MRGSRVWGMLLMPHFCHIAKAWLVVLMLVRRHQPPHFCHIAKAWLVVLMLIRR